jgi:hypothetical protein
VRREELLLGLKHLRGRGSLPTADGLPGLPGRRGQQAAGWARIRTYLNENLVWTARASHRRSRARHARSLSARRERLRGYGPARQRTMARALASQK